MIHEVLLADHDDAMSEVFSGHGCIASAEAFIKSETSNFAEHLAYLANLRRDLCISGAMRWPWSQEAPIKVDHRIRI